MGVWEMAGLAFLAMGVFIVFGMPIAFGLIVTGLGGIWLVYGERTAFGILGQLAFNQTTSYELSVVPMFILMGALITRARMSEDMYRLCHAFLGHRKGGLAMATVVACGMFSAVSGSSIATAATMAKVAMPEMRRYRYADTLASASVAAGGCLGNLIPPSVIMVLYGIATGTDVGQLMIAGIVPGIIAILFYMGLISAIAHRNPAAAPAAARMAWPERRAALASNGPLLVLFVTVIGGIYLGVFTATEAAGVGAFGALLLTVWRRALDRATLTASLLETVTMTAALFFVLVGALLFSNFMNLIGLPKALSALIDQSGLPPLAIIYLIFVVYVILGTFMESLPMVLLTVPIFFPVVTQLGYDPIWFGIIVVMVAELGLITPPVGLNLFIITTVVKDLPLGTVYRGIVPFIVLDIVRISLMILLPGVITFLPALMAQ